MLFKANRDFNKLYDYNGFTLGSFEHDDSDGFTKYDYEVYELVEIRDYDDGRNEMMYEKLKTLDISPYEKSTETIRKVFENYIDDFLKLNYGLEQSL